MPAGSPNLCVPTSHAWQMAALRLRETVASRLWTIHAGAPHARLECVTVKPSTSGIWDSSRTIRLVEFVAVTESPKMRH